MENNKEQRGFSYTYSAKEQAELKKIRRKYEAPEENKLEKLRRLDRQVARRAQCAAITVGVIGTLILGFGMSLTMSDFSAILGAYEHMSILIGVIIGVVGGTVAGVAYPIYRAVLRSERRKAAPEILRLTDELIK